jgi:hypothetical protein
VPADEHLFPDGVPATADATALALEQYKLMLSTTESLESRRQTLHNFFMSINSLFLAAIGLLAQESLDNSAVAIGVIVLSAAGAVLSVSWLAQLVSYGAVSSSKWAVINELEACLPSRPFDAEWRELQKRRYTSFTDNERVVPRAFAALYGIAFVAGALLAAGVVG